MLMQRCLDASDPLADQTYDRNGKRVTKRFLSKTVLKLHKTLFLTDLINERDIPVFGWVMSFDVHVASVEFERFKDLLRLAISDSGHNRVVPELDALLRRNLIDHVFHCVVFYGVSRPALYPPPLLYRRNGLVNTGSWATTFTHN